MRKMRKIVHYEFQTRIIYPLQILFGLNIATHFLFYFCNYFRANLPQKQSNDQGSKFAGGSALFAGSFVNYSCF